MAREGRLKTSLDDGCRFLLRSRGIRRPKQTLSKAKDWPPQRENGLTRCGRSEQRSPIPIRTYNAPDQPPRASLIACRERFKQRVPRFSAAFQVLLIVQP